MLPSLSQQGVRFGELLVGHKTRKRFAAFRRAAVTVGAGAGVPSKCGSVIQRYGFSRFVGVAKVGFGIGVTLVRGPFQVWKINFNGEPPVQVTKNGGVFAAESTDGRFLYYSKFEFPGIWKMPVEGGEEIRVTNQPEGEDWWNWAVVQNGIYFLDLVKRTIPWDANPHQAIVKFFDFAAGKEISVCSTDRSAGFGLAVSTDGKSIIYSQRNVAESSIMLVNDFR